MSNVWDSIFKRGIPEDLIRPYTGFPQMVESFHKKNVHAVLDVAMGAGRHTIQLAQDGFDVCAYDLSSVAIDLTKAELKKRNLKARVIQADMFGKTPFSDNTFDGVIAIQAIYHGYKENMQHALNEIWRVTKNGGEVWITVSQDVERSAMNSSTQENKLLVDEETYVPLSGREEGLPHFYADEQTVLEMMGKKYKDVLVQKDKKEKYLVISAHVVK